MTDPRLEITSYTIFDTVSGRKIATGTCNRRRLGRVPLYENQTLIEGEYPGNVTLVDGYVVDVEPEVVYATVENIKGAARQRIRRTDWRFMPDVVASKGPVPQDIIDYRDRIRRRSNELEAEIETSPIPLSELGNDEIWE